MHHQQQNYSSPDAMELQHSIRTPSILIATASIIIFSASLLGQNLVGATVFNVGDSEGWTNGVDYQTWAQQYNFTAGDSLLFSYIKVQHDVYQVAENTFRSCNVSAGVIKTYFSGNDVVNLTHAGKYWFLCNITGHCRGGMRFGITVASEIPGGRGSPPPPLPPLPEFQSPPLPVPAAGGVSEAIRGGWLVMAGVLWALTWI